MSAIRVSRSRSALQAASVVPDRPLGRLERAAGPLLSGLAPLGGTTRSVEGVA
jgi:hypothetical protein